MSADSSPAVVVDSHAHAVPIELLRQLHASGGTFPHVKVTAHEATFQVSFDGAAPTRPIAPGLTDAERRSSWLDENGIDRQVLGGWLDILGYQLPADECVDWAEAINEELLGLGADPRYLVLGTVPLQDPEAAAAGLRSVRAKGSPGVMIATRAGDLDLDDPRMTPFWEAADETGSVVFAHPGFGDASARYADFGLVNGLARLEDTTVSMARLLYRGIPAKYPGAKLVLAHGGGALPYVLGRLVRNHLINKQTTQDPLESFARLYFDSVVFDPATLSFLVEKVGADRVLLGSDYPFPIGDLTPRLVVEKAVDDSQHSLVDGQNACRLFGDPQ